MRRLHGLPLAIKVPLLVAGLMMVLGAIASERVLARLDDLQERRLRDLAALYFDGLSVAILPAALRSDVWEAFDALDRATRQERSISAQVTTLSTEDGVVLASSDPVRFPSGMPVPDEFTAAATPEAITLTTAAPTVVVRTPLTYQGLPVGQLNAELDVSDLIADRRKAVIYLLTGNALATGLLSLIGYLLVRRMLRPVSLLAEHMGRAEGPDLIEAADVPSGANEFGRLFRQYNALVRSELERKTDARRLAEQERLLSLGRLASSVAHEVNNPLGGLLNAVDTLKHHGHRPGVSERSIALLERGLSGIRDVVRAILETHRPRAYASTLTDADLEDLQLLVGPEIRRQQQTFDLSLEPGALEGFEVESGPVRQAVLNLLLNASAAAGPGGHVRLSVKQSDGQLAITVANDGETLPADMRHVLETGQPQGGSTGVGLRIVAETCAAIGGRLRVDEVAGETRVGLVIPRDRAEGRAA